VSAAKIRAFEQGRAAAPQTAPGTCPRSCPGFWNAVLSKASAAVIWLRTNAAGGGN